MTPTCPQCGSTDLRRVRRPFAPAKSVEDLGLLLAGVAAAVVLFAFEFVAWRLFGPFALFRCPKCQASFPYATIMRASERAN